MQKDSSRNLYNVAKDKFYNIPNTKQHRDYLAQARSSIGKGEPDKALESLSKINVESVTDSVLLLKAQWEQYSRDKIRDVLDHPDKGFNKINQGVLNLIGALKKEMDTYGKVDKEVWAYLIKRYTNRLNQKLANRQPINLRRMPTTEGTSAEAAETFVTISTEKAGAHIAQVFEEAHGRLLITGKPGAGKTILLLQLELALLESSADQLPVILNLATWKKDYITLESWLKDILPAELGVTKKYAVDVMQQNRLILLLDGLDEVAKSDRVSCLNAIGRYRASTNFQYVITSQIGEYSAIRKDAPVNLQIEVGDLTLNQMEAELKRMGYQHAEAIPLLKALQKHTLLHEAAQVPFYFNTLQLLFAGGKTLSDLNLKGHTAEAVQAELISQFVAYALTIPPDKNYTPKQAAYWLSFLASNMTKHNKVVFELSDLQYDWSPVALSRWHLFVAILLVGLIGAFDIPVFILLAFIFVIGLASISILVLAFGLIIIIGLVSISILVLAFGLAFTSDNILTFNFKHRNALRPVKLIYTQESIKWSWPLYFQHVKDEFVGELFAISLFAGLTLGLFAGFTFGLFVGLASGLFAGFTFGLFVGLTKGFRYYLKREAIATIQLNHPYQRFKNSARMLHFSILQHWHLMYVFSKKEWLPWKIVPFLNDMVAQQLLECPDGATWRFRHRILQDYFTKRREEIGKQEM